MLGLHRLDLTNGMASIVVKSGCCIPSDQIDSIKENRNDSIKLIPPNQSFQINRSNPINPFKSIDQVQSIPSNQSIKSNQSFQINRSSPINPFKLNRSIPINPFKINRSSPINPFKSIDQVQSIPSNQSIKSNQSFQINRSNPINDFKNALCLSPSGYLTDFHFGKTFAS